MKFTCQQIHTNKNESHGSFSSRSESFSDRNFQGALLLEDVSLAKGEAESRGIFLGTCSQKKEI
jgi:hypothetical protein